MTNNFEKVIGEGGSGNLYYGRLKNGHELAVKVLKNSLSQGTKELLAKVKLLVTVHHKCLVPFVGYCEEGGRLILLYENMSGGNLRQLLSGKASTSAFLTWSSRLQDALRVATGLDYLHSGCNPPIIHREVKTSNILLNAKMEAKTDFADLKLRGQYDVNSIWKVADIAMSCASQPSHSRPHMNDVVNQLKEAVETESYYEQTDTSSTEVQHSSSFSYEFSSSFLSTSYLPQAR